MTRHPPGPPRAWPRRSPTTRRRRSAASSTGSRPGLVDRIVVVDDASTDETPKVAAAKGAVVLTHAQRSGAGAAIRTASSTRWPRASTSLVDPGGQRQGPAAGDRAAARADRRRRIRLRPGIAVPERRRLRQHAVLPPARHASTCTRWLFSLIRGAPLHRHDQRVPRHPAVGASRDPRIDLDQPWLDQYELEPYLFYKMVRLGYTVKEVPVTKIYPPHELGYTKMKPITGWWSILRPVIPARPSSSRGDSWTSYRSLISPPITRPCATRFRPPSRKS